MSFNIIDGQYLTDAKHPLQFEVRSADTAKAKRLGRKNPHSCAAALGILHSYKGKVKAARVFLTRTYVQLSSGEWLRYETPRYLRQEMIALDRNGDFEPGSYLIKPVIPSAKSRKKKKKPDLRTDAQKPLALKWAVKHRKQELAAARAQGVTPGKIARNVRPRASRWIESDIK